MANLVPLGPPGVFPVESIHSQVEHSVGAAAVERRSLVVLQRLGVLLQHVPVIPAQAVHRAN